MSMTTLAEPDPCGCDLFADPPVVCEQHGQLRRTRKVLRAPRGGRGTGRGSGGAA